MSFDVSPLWGQRGLAGRAGPTAVVAAACLWMMPVAAAAASAVSIDSPGQGAQVSGKVAIEVSASPRISRVSFYVDGVRRHSDRSRPFSYRLDTTTLADGPHKLSIRGRNRAGRSWRDSISVVVRNGQGAQASPPLPTGTGVDETPPSVVFKAPLDRQEVSGVLDGGRECQARASDDRRIDRVEFTLDGEPLNTERFSPYECDFDSRKVHDGAHTLRAIAYDAAGNWSAASVNLTVDNDGKAGSEPTSTIAPTPLVAPTPDPLPVLQPPPGGESNPDTDAGSDSDADPPTDSDPAPPATSTTACEDGLDNDSNGKVDYPSDPGCSTPTDTSESPNALTGGADDALSRNFTGNFECGIINCTNELGKLNFNGKEVAAGCPDVTRDTTKAREGAASARFEVRDGCEIYSGERAEVKHGTSRSGSSTIPEGSSRYIGFSIWIDPNMPTPKPGQGHFIMMQVHTASGSPEITLQGRNNNFTLDWNSSTNAGKCGWSDYIGGEDRGRWVDFVIYAEYTGTGRIDMWKDGVKVIDNCTEQTSHGNVNYPKFGIYRNATSCGSAAGAWNNIPCNAPAIMWGHSYRIGTTYASVDPRIAR